MHRQPFGLTGERIALRYSQSNKKTNKIGVIRITTLVVKLLYNALIVWATMAGRIYTAGRGALYIGKFTKLIMLSYTHLQAKSFFRHFGCSQNRWKRCKIKRANLINSNRHLSFRTCQLICHLIIRTGYPSWMPELRYYENFNWQTGKTKFVAWTESNSAQWSTPPWSANR